MQADTLITTLQALQLVALPPSLFVVCFLLLVTRNLSHSIIPALYFLALACSFTLPLLDIFPSVAASQGWRSVLLLGESLLPALSFLLIMQLLLGRPPTFMYWLILALPLLGGSLLIYGSVYGGEACFADICLGAQSLKTLYGIFSASCIFLLLIFHFSSREDALIPSSDPHRAHKYWLLMALILLNLLLLGIDLASLLGQVDMPNAALAATVIRITFIYLVLTSLFRVFDRAVEMDMARLPTAARVMLSEKDHICLQGLKRMMEELNAYREMGLNREAIAERLGVGGHVVSRIINVHYGKNMNEFVNGYRVEEAKQRLASEPVSITTIAFEVGFASIASFNRVFKDMVGCSPTEYRAAQGTVAAISA